MRSNIFKKLTAFLSELEQQGVSYSLAHNRDEAIMVIATAPGERWEIEFLDNGTVEVERFTSDGQIYGQEILKELFARYSEEEPNDIKTQPDAEVVTAGRE
jgi:hypothetical protein